MSIRRPASARLVEPFVRRRRRGEEAIGEKREDEKRDATVYAHGDLQGSIAPRGFRPKSMPVEKESVQLHGRFARLEAGHRNRERELGSSTFKLRPSTSKGLEAGLGRRDGFPGIRRRGRTLLRVGKRKQNGEGEQRPGQPGRTQAWRLGVYKVSQECRTERFPEGVSAKLRS